MQGNQYVIMIIDDDRDFITATKTVLETSGYIVREADSAEQGIHTYKDAKPDLILVDLMMEEIDSGTNFVRDLKLLGNTAPIFLLSAAGDEMTDNVDYSELGFAGVFQKPVDTRRLLNVLKAKLK
jgi:DNA-binding response OmpR family regulator